MKIKVAKDLYPKTVVLKASYVFTDVAYIYIYQDSDNYIIDIEAKDNQEVCEHEFKNELLSQALRYEINKETKSIRELIVSRALASTILDESDEELKLSDNYVDDDILKDWFDSDDNKKI